MTEDDDDARPRLGDLLAKGSEWRSRPPSEAPTRTEAPSLTDQAWNPAPMEGALVWLAQRYDEDAEQVLQDLRGNTALARLLRKAMGHSEMSRDLRAYLMITTLPADMRAEQKRAIVSEMLSSERNALGRRTGGATPGSIERMARRGRHEFEELERRRWIDALADMFVPKT